MTHREQYTISTGRSRLETAWRERRVSWPWLCDRLNQVLRTAETAQEYASMNKAAKGVAKDHGGFVGGALEGGVRKSSTVLSRSVLTLDIDYGRADTLGVVADSLAGTAWCAYSTHSSTAQAPRYRLVIPLSRDVSPEEYVAIGRRVAGDIGIEVFDDSTYEPSRLMYWPSAPKDGDFVFRCAEGEDLDVEATLSRYTDWRDTSEWPVSSRVQKLSLPGRSRQEDPTEKGGVIGAFCRCYGIAEAIDTFLPDTYTEAGPGRYTYTGGSTAGGLVVYEDKWAYSHHGTDPVGGREVNAFDLVRIHKYGSMDGGSEADTPVNRLPSFKAMSELALADERVRRLTAKERMREIAEDFGDIEDGTSDWTSELQMDDRRKNFLSSPFNFELICRNDPRLAGTTRRDVFRGQDVIQRDLPWAPISPEHRHWNDDDDKGLVAYISETYKLQGKQAICDAHDLVMSQSSYHPVRDYLNSLRWDGTPRLDTLLVDYLGAADNALTRAMTRKHFTAAVARIMEPGRKYDYVLTLSGPEGIGKSQIIRRMGGQWFDDSFSSNDVGDKQAMEQVRGRWLIELGELKEYKRSTVESFKAFISKQTDEYRPAYGHKVQCFPRQCVFFATTNEQNFLKGDSGNRRFWPVQAYVTEPRLDVFEMTDHTVDQVWAEAVTRWREGEELFLSREQEAEARTRQEDFNEVAVDERIGLIESYLLTVLPTGWWTLTRQQRADWFKENRRREPGDEGQLRQYICAMEVATECFRKDLNRYEMRDVNLLLRRLLGDNSFVGPTNTSDKEYGCQRRFKLDDFYATHKSILQNESNR